MPVVCEVAKKVTALCCGPGDAERDWKSYQMGCTKARVKMGEVADDEYGKIDEEEDCEIENLVASSRPSASSSATQTTATKLATVHGLLHCKEYNDYSLSKAAAELKSFDSSDVSALRAIFEKTNDKNATPTARGSIPFKNFVEAWETNLTLARETMSSRPSCATSTSACASTTRRRRRAVITRSASSTTSPGRRNARKATTRSPG